jgi:hypothetical protein
MKVDEEALKIASAKLRKLRLTDNIAIKDTPPPSKTVKSVFQDSLGGLYDDDAITYALRFGVRYYLEAVEYSVPQIGGTLCKICRKPENVHVRNGHKYHAIANR